MGPKLDAPTQKDVTNVDVLMTRCIFGPRVEVNARITNERSPNCAVPKHSALARRILYWEVRYPGIPILISKLGVKVAFKLIPVSAKCRAYMGCRFANYLRMCLAQCAGWRPSPGN